MGSRHRSRSWFHTKTTCCRRTSVAAPCSPRRTHSPLRMRPSCCTRKFRRSLDRRYTTSRTTSRRRMRSRRSPRSASERGHIRAPGRNRLRRYTRSQAHRSGTTSHRRCRDPRRCCHRRTQTTRGHTPKSGSARPGDTTQAGCATTMIGGSGQRRASGYSTIGTRNVRSYCENQGLFLKRAVAASHSGSFATSRR